MLEMKELGGRQDSEEGADNKGVEVEWRGELKQPEEWRRQSWRGEFQKGEEADESAGEASPFIRLENIYGNGVVFYSIIIAIYFFLECVPCTMVLQSSLDLVGFEASLRDEISSHLAVHIFV